MTEFIGARISLISKSNIRYVGILHEINSETSTVALEQVTSHGTEGRRGGEGEIAGSENVYEYIVFRGSDVKDLRIEEPAQKKPQVPPPQLDDPAILGQSSARPYAQQPAPFQQQQPAPPPAAPPPPHMGVPPYYFPHPQQQRGFGPSPYQNAGVFGAYPPPPPPGGQPPMAMPAPGLSPQQLLQQQQQQPPQQHPPHQPQLGQQAPSLPEPSQQLQQQQPQQPQQQQQQPQQQQQQPQQQSQQQQQQPQQQSQQQQPLPTGPQNRPPPQAPIGPSASRQASGPVGRQAQANVAPAQAQNLQDQPSANEPISVQQQQLQQPLADGPSAQSKPADQNSSAAATTGPVTQAPAKAPTGPKTRGGIVPALPLTSPARTASVLATAPTNSIAVPAAVPTIKNDSASAAAVRDLADKVNRLAVSAGRAAKAVDANANAAANRSPADTASQSSAPQTPPPSQPQPQVKVSGAVTTTANQLQQNEHQPQHQQQHHQQHHHQHQHQQQHHQQHHHQHQQHQQPRPRLAGIGGFVSGRGSTRVGYRGGFNSQTRKVEVPATDYDFQYNNDKFNKQDLVKEAIASGTDENAPHPTDGTARAEKAGEANGDGAGDVVIPPAPKDGFYDRKSSFFDNISCENKERAEAVPGERRGGAQFRSEEQKKNLETFGQGSVDGGYSGYRGGWRGRGRARGSGFRGRGSSYNSGSNYNGRNSGYRPQQQQAQTGTAGN